MDAIRRCHYPPAIGAAKLSSITKLTCDIHTRPEVRSIHSTTHHKGV